MSRHLCGHCGALTPTTASPNTVEGFFVDENTLESWLLHYRPLDGLVCDWLDEHATRGGRCPECGMVTLFPDEPEAPP